MKLIKSYLAKKNIFQTRDIDEQTVFFIFRKIVKEEFGMMGLEKLIPEHYNNKTIFVRSESSTWASELWLNRMRLVRMMNEELGEGAIEKIKVK